MFPSVVTTATRSASSAGTADATRCTTPATSDGPASARPQPKHDRRRRRLVAGDEDRPLRQDQVHARRLDRGQGPDRPRQLALERAAIEHPLLELRRAEPHLVEALEADAPAARQAGARQLEAQLARSRLGYLDGRAVRLDAVGHLHLLELRDDRRRVLPVELEKRRRLGLVDLLER